LVAGSSGSGKTILGVQFLCAGAAAGERGLLVSFEESPLKLERIAAAGSLPLTEYVNRGLIEFLHTSPLDLLPEALLHDIRDRLARGDLRRLVVDSLTDLELATRGSREVSEFVCSLFDLAAEAGVTTLITTEAPDLPGASPVTSQHLSVMADGILLLTFLEAGGAIRRQLTVRKMRGCHHDTSIRDYTIDASGLRVLQSPDSCQA